MEILPLHLGLLRNPPRYISWHEGKIFHNARAVLLCEIMILSCVGPEIGSIEPTSMPQLLMTSSSHTGCLAAFQYKLTRDPQKKGPRRRLE